MFNGIGRTSLGTADGLLLQDAKAPLALSTLHQNAKSQSSNNELHKSLKSHRLLSQVFSRYSNSLSWLYFNHNINARSDNSTAANSSQQIQLSSVMKKRRKKIKLHKLKKKRRRDRYKVKV